MKWFLPVGLILVLAPAVHATIVIHDGAPGIVAMSADIALDHNGQVWAYDTDHWVRWNGGTYDPPVPVDQIKLWELGAFVTMNNEYWQFWGGAWWDRGLWPGFPVDVGDGVVPVGSFAVGPNPTSGSCRLSLALSEPGPVSVAILDAAGRLVRQLHDGALPAGEFSLVWDGKDAAGLDVVSGVYFARIAHPGGEVSQRLVVAR